MAELVALGDIPARNAARLGRDGAAVTHDGETLSWGELADHSARRANALAAHGVGQGDRVGLALPNSNAIYELTFALWQLGATPTMVSPRLPPAELDAILALAEPRAIVAEDPALQAAFGALPEDFGQDHADATPRAGAIAPRWKAMTSGGSTGLPKLIIDNTPACFPEDAAGLRIPIAGVMLNPGPLYHNFPFAMTHVAMLAGSQVVGMSKFDAEEFLKLVERHRVQWVNLVPTMMSRIAKLPDAVRARYDVSSLETVWHTAAPIPPALKQFWIDWVGPDKIWEMYGGTEGFATTQLNGTEWLAHRGSVGRPAEAEILVRAEDGSALPPGEIGEIYLRKTGADAAAEGYRYVGADKRRLPDGFESFGDYGWVDADGYLYIADRRTDLILSGGRNVYPAEVEAALLDHPAVDQAIVIGLPDDDLGARVHAIVKLEPGETTLAEDLLNHAAQRLVVYKLPRTIEFTEDTLRDEAGKARRSQLRAERITAQTASA